MTPYELTWHQAMAARAKGRLIVLMRTGTGWTARCNGGSEFHAREKRSAYMRAWRFLHKKTRGSN